MNYLQVAKLRCLVFYYLQLRGAKRRLLSRVEYFSALSLQFIINDFSCLVLLKDMFLEACGHFGGSSDGSIRAFHPKYLRYRSLRLAVMTTGGMERSHLGGVYTENVS